MRIVIKQKNLDECILKKTSSTDLVFIQGGDIVIIEPESIPELLKFIKENYNL